MNRSRDLASGLPTEASGQAAGEGRLANALAAFLEERRAGGHPDVEGFMHTHPELAEEFRQLWGTALVAEELTGPFSFLADARTSPLSGAASAGCPALAAGLPRAFGDYELHEEVGRGGMGIVYRATQRSLGRTVALKMILQPELASGEDLARFRAEAAAAAGFGHPNLVPVYEVGEQDGRVYFTMPYIEGGTLAQRLSQGPMPGREAAGCLVAVCRAVEHAHRHGVLHRDLKPTNILIDPDSRPHVSDFGLAKRAAGGPCLTPTGAVVGTPSYMSPEQAAGSRGTLTPASDVYSLGAILYEMLTGRPPFQGPTALDTLLLVLEQDPVPPRLLNARVDRDLEMICLKCLQKPAELRYQGAGELADELDKYLRGEPIATGLRYLVSRILRETHHAAILENWGLLWMWHSLVLLVLCGATNFLHLQGVSTPGPYLALWGAGLWVWSLVFWTLRRRGGPVTFVERQIAHVWAASTAGSFGLFVIEWKLGLPVLTLSPVLALLAGMVFLVKAGTLSGTFYLSAAASFVTALAMAAYPRFGLSLFGAVSAASFFLPGLKYYRQARRPKRATAAAVQPEGGPLRKI